MWNNIVKHETAALKINLQELDRKNLCDLAFVTIDGKTLMMLFFALNIMMLMICTLQ